MIWESKLLMSVIDVVIIGAVLLSVYTFFSYRTQLRGMKVHLALVLILLGQLVFAGHYLMDLLTMTVFPLFMSEQQALSMMEALHLEIIWIIALVGILSFSIGLTFLTRVLLSAKQSLEYQFTKRNQAEEELRASQRLMRDVIDAIPHHLFLKDLKDGYLMVNRNFGEYWGIDPGHPEEFSLASLPKEEDDLKDFFLKTDQRLLETGKMVDEVSQFKRKDGSEDFRRHIKVPHRDSSGDIIGIIALSVDISDQKRAEEDLKRHRDHLEELVLERTRELESTQSDLIRKEKLAILGELTATVSHELRNPLGTIRSSIFFIGDVLPSEDDKLMKAVDRVKRNITRCDKIIDEMLDFAREQNFTKESFLLDDWIGSLLDEQSLPEGIILVRRFAADGVSVELAPERFMRAVINVVENACQALTENNTSSIGGREGSVTVSTGIKGKWIQISFSDNGPGISSELLPKIFEPLFSTKNFGVGLGLPIVKKILAEHGGRSRLTARKVKEPGLHFGCPGALIESHDPDRLIPF